MSGIFLISTKDFLRRETLGVYDAVTSKTRLTELCEAWDLDRSRNILIDLREADISFHPTEVRAHVEAVLSSGVGSQRLVAILYKAERGFDAVRFFEFLITISGDLKLKVFEEFEEAVAWLSSAEKIEVGVRGKER